MRATLLATSVQLYCRPAQRVATPSGFSLAARSIIAGREIILTLRIY
jgi:hypothetical protein